MKVAAITDTHIGCRNDNKPILNHQLKFFKETFIEYIKSNNIKHVIHLGDVFDRRTSVNFSTLDMSRKCLFDPLRDMGVEVHAIVGNHDVFYKNTNEVNSVELLINDYSNINVYSKDPVDIELGGCSIGLIPWITEDNSNQVVEFLKTTKSDIIGGHFEIAGFEMHKGIACEHGMKASDFKRFDVVMSGHFHHKSFQGNIHYLGSPYQMAWYDYGDERGFHVLDTATRDLEFIRNPTDMFKKIECTSNTSMSDVSALSEESMDGTFVKVVLRENGDDMVFSSLMALLNDKGIADLKLDDMTPNADIEAVLTEDVDLEDTLAMLRSCIGGLDVENKDDVEKMVVGLYMEASNK